MDGQTDGWMDGRMDGWMDGSINGDVDEWMREAEAEAALSTCDVVASGRRESMDERICSARCAKSSVGSGVMSTESSGTVHGSHKPQRSSPSSTSSSTSPAGWVS